VFKPKVFLLSLSLSLLLVFPSFLSAVEEKLTITTYYPSPYGSYNQLYVADKLGIGTTAPQVQLHLYTTSGAGGTTQMMRLTPGGGVNTDGTASRIAGYSDIMNVGILTSKGLPLAAPLLV